MGEDVSGVPTARCCSARRSGGARAADRQRRRRGKGSGSCSTRARPGSVTRTAINNGRPVIQSKLEALGYTVDWEDCNHLGTARRDELQQRGQEPADLHGREPRALRRDRDAEHVLEVRRRQPAGPAARATAEGRDHQVRPERRRHRRRSTTRPTPAPASRSGTGGTAAARTPSSAPSMPGHAATNAHRQRGDRAGRRPRTTCRPRTSRTRGVRRRALQLPAQRPRRPPRARHVRRAHVQPGRQRQGQDHPITWCKLYDGANINDGTPTRRSLPRRPHLDHRHGPLRRPLHRERRRQPTWSR